ncbi:MAG: hypothetical protein ACTHQ3_19605 [Motilibacteraceae bacterium]
MRRWIPRRLAVLAAVVLAIGLVAPAGASAHSRTHGTGVGTRVATGTTTVTTAPGVATALLGAGIAPFVTSPGRSTLILPPSGPALVASYPVTGGTLGLQPPRGVIRHSGGLLLVNVTNGKMAQVDNFVIDIRARVLTAHVVGTTARVPMFRLDLGHARIVVRHHVVTISGVRLLLTSTAATALNDALGTKIFAKDLLFGTASTRVVLR